MNQSVRLDSDVAIREFADQLAAQMPETPALNVAYFKFWHAVGNVQKNAVNPHHKSNYANLEAVMAVVKPHLEKAGLVLLQVPGDIRDGAQAILSTLLHAESGESWSFRMEIPLGEKKTAQAAGSTITYARRYFVLTLSGMCPVDDDGNAASEEAPDEDPQEDPVKLIAEINKFKPIKGEDGKAAALRLSDVYKARVERSTSEARAAYVAKRKEVKV